MEETFQSASEQILEALYVKMQPGFVRKQVVQLALEASVHGKHRADRHPVLFQDDETDEPKAAQIDILVCNTVKTRFRDAPSFSPTAKRLGNQNSNSRSRRQSSMNVLTPSQHEHGKGSKRLNLAPKSRDGGNSTTQLGSDRLKVNKDDVAKDYFYVQPFESRARSPSGATGSLTTGRRLLKKNLTTQDDIVPVITATLMPDTSFTLLSNKLQSHELPHSGAPTIKISKMRAASTMAKRGKFSTKSNKVAVRKSVNTYQLNKRDEVINEIRENYGDENFKISEKLIKTMRK